MCLTALTKKILGHLVYECLVSPVTPEALATGCSGNTEGEGNTEP